MKTLKHDILVSKLIKELTDAHNFKVYSQKTLTFTFSKSLKFSASGNRRPKWFQAVLNAVLLI